MKSPGLDCADISASLLWRRMYSQHAEVNQTTDFVLLRQVRVIIGFILKYSGP